MSIFDDVTFRYAMMAVLALAGLASGLFYKRGRFSKTQVAIGVLSLAAGAILMTSVVRWGNETKSRCQPGDVKCTDFAEYDKIFMLFIFLTGWFVFHSIGRGITILVDRRRRPRTVGTHRSVTTDQTVWPSRPEWDRRRRR